MSEFYPPSSRELQDRFDTRRLADRIEQRLVTDTLSESDCAFIAARDMFFLATTDEHGQPACSYKGGDPGFVRATDARTLVFPNYDGNGMFLSMGNVLSTRKVGMLFIDFEAPRRLRVSGDADALVGSRAAARVSRGAVRGSRRRHARVPELPALHPPLHARRAVHFRSARGLRDAGSELEEERLGQGRPARSRSRARALRTTLSFAPAPERRIRAYATSSPRFLCQPAIDSFGYSPKVLVLAALRDVAPRRGVVEHQLDRLLGLGQRRVDRRGERIDVFLPLRIPGP